MALFGIFQRLTLQDQPTGLLKAADVLLGEKKINYLVLSVVGYKTQHKNNCSGVFDHFIISVLVCCNKELKASFHKIGSVGLFIASLCISVQLKN